MGPSDSPVLFDCLINGDVPVPTRVPEVVWRAGIDLNPLDVTKGDDIRWLESLIWPGQPARVDRLRAAVSIARADPPMIRRGDLLAELPSLAAEAPADATLVVFHSTVLAYLSRDARTAFIELVQSLPGHWISNEAPGVLPELLASIQLPLVGPSRFLLCLDGRPVALAGSHGQTLHWLTVGS